MFRRFYHDQGWDISIAKTFQQNARGYVDVVNEKSAGS